MFYFTSVTPARRWCAFARWVQVRCKACTTTLHGESLLHSIWKMAYFNAITDKPKSQSGEVSPETHTLARARCDFVRPLLSVSFKRFATHLASLRYRSFLFQCDGASGSPLRADVPFAHRYLSLPEAVTNVRLVLLNQTARTAVSSVRSSHSSRSTCSRPSRK